MEKIKRFILNLGRLRRFLKRLRLEPVHLFLPSMLAVIAALFEAGTFALLIPTIKGIIGMDFEFVYSIKWVGSVVSAFPQVFSNRNGAIFCLLITLVLFSAIFKSLFSYLSALIVTKQVRQFAHELRCLIFGTYLEFKKSYLDKTSIGHLHNILIGDTERVALEFRSMQIVIYNVTVLFAYAFVLTQISWKLTLVAIVSLPILFFIFNQLISQIKSSSQVFSQNFALLGKKISNSLSCLPLVKAFAMENNEKDWFQGASHRVREQQVEMDKRILLIAPVQEVFFLVVILLLTVFMAYLVIRLKEGDVSSFLVFFVVFRRAATSLSILTSFQASISSIVGILDQIACLLRDHQIYSEKKSGKQLSQLKQGIKIKNLTFRYADREVLKDVSFDVDKGKMVALVGRTGSGKSTLVQLMMRFYDPPINAIYVDGEDLSDLDVFSWRRQIAYISQDNYFFDAPLEVNLNYGSGQKHSEKDILAVLEKAQLGDLIRKLPHGIKTEIGERGVRLSGGEKQRLAIARAMLKNPEILILDEATSALDSQTEKLVQGAIDEVVKGRTTIVIAHRLTTVQNADFIVVLDGGRQVESGSFASLMENNGHFKKYWITQANVLPS